MTEQQSPWAVPDTQTVIEPAPSAFPSVPFDGRSGDGARLGSATATRIAPGYASGRVSKVGAPPPPPPPDVLSGGPGDGDDDPVRRNQRILKWLGGGAVLV